MCRFCACLGCLSLSALDISNGRREKRGPESHLRLLEVPSEVKRSYPSVSPRQTFIYITTMDNLQPIQTVLTSTTRFEQTPAWKPLMRFTNVHMIPSLKRWPLVSLWSSMMRFHYFNIAIAGATLVGWQSSARYRPQCCIGISVWVKNLKRFYKILLKFFWCQHKLICRIEKAWYYMLNGVCTRLPFSKHSYSEQTVSLCTKGLFYRLCWK